MKTLIFSATGFPSGVQTLTFLQDNTLAMVKALAKQHENYTVIWGMELNDAKTQLSEGAFAFNGEIIPFIQSLILPTITVNEVVTTANFNTNPNNTTSLENLPAYSSKTAQFGSGGQTTFNYNQLKRLPKTKIFQLQDFELSSSGGFIRDITSEVDIKIIERAFDWDFVWVEESDGVKSIRSFKQHNGSTIESAGFVVDAKLLYTATNVRIQLNISNPPIISPKLIIHYL